jgi:hypothetical protein
MSMKALLEVLLNDDGRVDKQCQSLKGGSTGSLRRLSSRTQKDSPEYNHVLIAG